MASLDPKALVDIASSSTNPSFAVKTLLRASEIYISQLPTASSRRERSQNIKSILAQAECLKQWNYGLSKSEEIILLKGSLLSGCKVPPWNGKPSPEIIDQLVLSPDQINQIDHWVDGREIYGSNIWPDQMEIKQMLLSNCSFVASLIALSPLNAANLSSILLADKSSFTFKIYLNGTYRRLSITPNIPVSLDLTPLTVMSTHLGPILVEKAFHALRNSYDFQGSNSATDLFLLLGYIPEIVRLHSPEIDLDEIRLRGGVMTVGSNKYEEIGQHNFALTEFDQNTVRVVNPWGGSKLHEWTQLHRSFETLYISHDPVQFRHRYQKHFSGPQQFVVHPSHGEICVLLSQHISTWTDTWTAMDVFLGSTKIYDFKNPILKGHKLDSFYTFCRLKPFSGPRILVPVSPSSSNWTISLYSQESIYCEHVASPAFRCKEIALWKGTSKINSSTFITNQQYRITITSVSFVALVITSAKGLVRLDLLSSDERVDRLRSGDCLANSGNYQPSQAVILKVLDPGKYIVIPTCFESTEGGYEIQVESDSFIKLEKLAPYDAGKFKKSLATTNQQVHITVSRLTEIWIIVLSREFIGLQFLAENEEVIWEENISDGRLGLFSGKLRVEKGFYFLKRVGEDEWNIEIISDNRIEVG
ncbi:Calpain-like protease palB/RIM13 [Neolecta irregularis DAH-3]|uniref:Calpain-like protease palB/RIM13 n=1 Tax=Neolecta irregularis (strain DAH-3) TaxID=1198029 RepID=A0A1U7LWZ7_NEOID|nr:Calpain-like protease palB/RIM13 [Neolecta irregularis DAH-3]|eukprot:OLL27041.1 Calpain-like protease palB/RIM13 [Neolecta irregularis DAH-3]